MGSNLLMYVKSFLLNLKNLLPSNSTLRKSKKIKYIKRFMWGVGGRKGMDWEIGISRCKPLYIEWINAKTLMYSIGNYIQYHIINHNGKEYEKIKCMISVNTLKGEKRKFTNVSTLIITELKKSGRFLVSSL